MHTTLFRPLRREDYPALEEIIRNTWNYDRLTPRPAVARRMARLYLQSCLLCHTFSQVAVQDGVPVGIILARHGRAKGPRLSHRLAVLGDSLALLASPHGRAMARIFSRVEETDRALLRDAGDGFDSELVFFAVGQDQRGAGTGKALLDAALSYLREQGGERLYLFTDTSCNFGFYEHFGFARRAERVLDFRPAVPHSIRMFLYARSL